jgi:hypothetical protein
VARKKKRKRIVTAKEACLRLYCMMEDCLNQIEYIAGDNAYGDLEHTCMMFETDMNEVYAAIQEVR